VRSRLFSAVAVALINHHDFPNSQGRAHNIRLSPGIGIPKFHRRKPRMPQAFFDQLSCRFAWAFVDTHGEPIWMFTRNRDGRAKALEPAFPEGLIQRLNLDGIYLAT
jgi:hypothetical protein